MKTEARAQSVLLSSAPVPACADDFLSCRGVSSRMWAANDGAETQSSLELGAAEEDGAPTLELCKPSAHYSQDVANNLDRH